MHPILLHEFQGDYNIPKDWSLKPRLCTLLSGQLGEATFGQEIV